MKGKLEQIRVFTSGYEVNLTIDFGEIGRITCGALLEFEHNPLKIYDNVEVYVEDNPPVEIKKDSLLDVDLKIIYGNSLRKINRNSNLTIGFMQDIANSPHANFQCEIIEQINDDSVICYVNEAINRIEAEFEFSTSEVVAGDFVSFSGEFGIKSISVIQ